MTTTVHRPLFIVFEGIDGAGTTTQTGLLAARLRSAGIDVVQTREPGGTPLAEAIRELVLDPRFGDVDAVAELFLYGAARRQHARELIGPSLAAGKPVICDRYAASTAAYQGGGRGLAAKLVHTVNVAAMGSCVPDLIVLLDLPVTEATQRRRSRPGSSDRLELAGLEFQERVRQSYCSLAAASSGGAWLRVGAAGSANELAEAIHRELTVRWPAFPFAPPSAAQREGNG